MRKLSMDELNRKSVEEFKESEKLPVIVVLENIRSAYNVGSVFRTADAFLLEAIYITGYTCTPPHKEIKKTALGAEDTVTWKHFTNATLAVNELKVLVADLVKQRGNNSVALSTGYLKQNVPNPAGHNTTISYYVPDNAGYAQIRVTDVKGAIIKSFNTAKGEGQINIKAGELPVGTYNYTLYINDKTIDTKQMVLVK